MIEQIRREYGEKERQRIRDRIFNQKKHRQEIEGDEFEGSLFDPVSYFSLIHRS